MDECKCCLPLRPQRDERYPGESGGEGHALRNGVPNGGAGPVLLVKRSILPRPVPVWSLHEDRRHAIINQLSVRCVWSAHLAGCGGNGRISTGGDPHPQR